MKFHILIAEDDFDIIEILRLYLENEGFAIFTALDGEKAFEIFQNNKIDIAIVDIMMPKINGFELINKLRDVSNIPILVLSAKNLNSDKILGLSLGADDYLTKPFNPLEVVARVKSALRRYFELNCTVENENVKIEIGDLELDTMAFSLKKKDKLISLTPMEYKIVLLLMRTPGKIYTKMQILENINGDYLISDDNTLMVHISKIREKIEDDSKNPRYLKTVRGLGYKIETE